MQTREQLYRLDRSGRLHDADGRIIERPKTPLIGQREHCGYCGGICLRYLTGPRECHECAAHLVK